MSECQSIGALPFPAPLLFSFKSVGTLQHTGVQHTGVQHPRLPQRPAAPRSSPHPWAGPSEHKRQSLIQRHVPPNTQHVLIHKKVSLIKDLETRLHLWLRWREEGALLLEFNIEKCHM